MTLYRKDGSVYKVSKPNPLMMTQEVWDDQYVLLNMENFGKIVEVAAKPVVQEIKEILTSPEEPQEKPKKSKFRDYKQETLFCLPAQNKIIKDELYGEPIVIPGYGQPIKFNGVTIAIADGQIAFWLSEQITSGSIIFQSAQRFWWRVKDIASDESGDGYIVQCVVSHETPHFEGV